MLWGSARDGVKVLAESVEIPPPPVAWPQGLGQGLFLQGEKPEGTNSCGGRFLSPSGISKRGDGVRTILAGETCSCWGSCIISP